MNKHLFLRTLPLQIIFLLFGHLLLAEPIDQQTAALIAKHFFQGTTKGQALAENIQLDLVYGNNQQAADNQAQNLLYVFNVNDRAGYVIVAADDAVRPILGYSTEGAFELHPSVEKWLEDYKSQLFYAIENKQKATAATRAQWESLKTSPSNAPDSGGVGPLLESKWNQGPNENIFCPGGSVTGCVATAMAQIMYYWKYPAQGQGSYSYLETGSVAYPSYGMLSADFGSTVYPWGLMYPVLSSPSPEVSLISYHCGISVNMNYSPASSGSNTDQVPNALKTYFKYDPNTVVFVDRSDYPGAAWNNLLKVELNAFRPVQYRGSGSGGGHSFVCDGYDDQGFFHFNWGWGGASDGFFTVDALNPGTLGAGGGSGGFNIGQGAVIGIQPDPAVQAELVMVTSLLLSPPVIFGNQPVTVIATQFANTGSQPFEGEVSLGIYDPESGALIKTSPDVETYFNVGGAGAYINKTFTIGSLAPGLYSTSLVYRPISTSQWSRIPEGQLSNSSPLTVITSSPIYVHEKPILTPIAVQQNMPVTIKATLINADVQLPVFAGSISSSLHTFEGAWVQDLEIKSNQLLVYNSPVELTFNLTGINADPGAYQIVFWAEGPNGWEKVNVQSGVDATTILTILPAPPVADIYEPNNSSGTATNLPLNFGGNTALISTFGANNHTAQDDDYYRLVFPSDPTYIYKVKAVLNDAAYQPNGGGFTNDCIWRFHNGNTWSLPFDDVLQMPGMSFLMNAGTEAQFFVKPYFAGTTGTYLLELEITRMPAFDAPCGAINLPVNGMPQTGFSNVNATASFDYEPGIPLAAGCTGNSSWCDTEDEPRLLHSVWFSFQAPPSGAVEISTCGLSDFDTQLALYSANGCGNLASFQLWAANDDGPNCAQYSSSLQHSGLTPGMTYYILVDGYETQTGNFGIKITPLQNTAVQHIAASPEVLAVSPNPSAGSLNIQYKGNEQIDEIRLTELNGRQLMQVSALDGQTETQLDLSMYPCGVYLLQVQAGDRIYTQKVVVQR